MYYNEGEGKDWLSFEERNGFEGHATPTRDATG